MHAIAALLALVGGPLAADPVPANPLPPMTVWSFVEKGGPTMVLIAICSLVSLAVIVERFIVLRRRSVIPPDFLTGLRAVAADRSRALEYCRANSSPIAAILGAAIQRRGEPREQVEKAVGDAGRRELVRLRHRMRLLGALPQVATMLGLLGTVAGMIKTFQAVANYGQALGKTELLARGIFEAWANTAAGLLVAIPVLVFYQILMGRIDALIVAMDRTAADWIEEERRPQSPAVEQQRPIPTPLATPTPAASLDGLAAVPA